MRLSAAALVRLLCLVFALFGFLLAFGLPRRLAQTFGSLLGRRAPVFFHRLICAGLGVWVRRHGALGAATNSVDRLQPRFMARHTDSRFAGADELSCQEGGREPSLGPADRSLAGRRLRRSPPALMHPFGQPVNCGGDGRGIAGCAVRRGHDQRRQSPPALPVFPFRGGAAGCNRRSPRHNRNSAGLSRLLPTIRVADDPRRPAPHRVVRRHDVSPPFFSIRQSRIRGLRRLPRKANSRFGGPRPEVRRPARGSRGPGPVRPGAGGSRSGCFPGAKKGLHRVRCPETSS